MGPDPWGDLEQMHVNDQGAGEAEAQSHRPDGI